MGCFAFLVPSTPVWCKQIMGCVAFPLSLRTSVGQADHGLCCIFFFSPRQCGASRSWAVLHFLPSPHQCEATKPCAVLHFLLFSTPVGQANHGLLSIFVSLHTSVGQAHHGLVCIFSLSPRQCGASKSWAVLHLLPSPHQCEASKSCVVLNCSFSPRQCGASESSAVFYFLFLSTPVWGKQIMGCVAFSRSIHTSVGQANHVPIYIFCLNVRFAVLASSLP